MKNSPIVSIMGTDHNTKDLLEEDKEEDVGLACPPFDEHDFMAAENSFFDLSEQVFFSGIEDHQKSVERVEGSSRNHNAVQIKQKKHGKGKDMKSLEQFYKHKDNGRKDTYTETKAENTESNEKTSTKAEIVDEKVSLQHKIIESNKKTSRKADEKVSLEHRVIETNKRTSTKDAIVDEKVSLEHRVIKSNKKISTKADAKVSLEHRVNLAKSKLHESCQQIEKEIKRGEIRVLDVSELPEFPQVKCKSEKHHSGCAHKFRSFTENIEFNKKTSTKAAIVDEIVSLEHRIIGSNKKTSTKAAIVDENVSLAQKINLAKRKLHERYEQIEKEKKRRQIQVLDVSELPKFPQCRPEKHHNGFAHKFRGFADCH